MYCRIFIITPECFAVFYFLSFKFLNPYIIPNLKKRPIQGDGQCVHRYPAPNETSCSDNI
jgi:hypothetical protein